MSEEQKIIDLENEISFLKDALCKKQKEIEEKNCLIDVLQHKIEELLDNKKEINYIKPIDIPVHNYISADKISEKIKEYQEKAEDVKQKYKGVYAYKDDYLEALAKIEGYQELLEEN